MSEPVFLVEVFGEFSSSQVRVVWRDEPRPSHTALDALISETWARRRKECEQAGTMLFNGRLVRYLRHRIERGVVTIEAGPTDFREFIGTNWLNHARADEFGWELFSNPIGTSATLITSDGWLLYGRRSRQVACHAGYLHPFGGTLEPRDRRQDGSLDAFASILRELDEELGIRPDELEDLLCLGLIRDCRIRQPELVFDARARPTRSDIAGRLRTEDPDQEHVAVAACRDHPDAILPFIRSTRPISPVAVGALCLHGRRRFGNPWYTWASSQLASG